MNEIIIAAIGAIVTMVTALITARNIKSKTTTTGGSHESRTFHAIANKSPTPDTKILKE